MPKMSGFRITLTLVHILIKKHTLVQEYALNAKEKYLLKRVQQRALHLFFQPLQYPF